MSELRKDPVIGRWVIIAAERAKRPSDFIMEKKEKSIGFCPFCPGNEEKTPDELLAFQYPRGQEGDESFWWLRVVPNKFPALQESNEVESFKEGIYEKMNGFGNHEVIIETPVHHCSMKDFDLKQIEEVFRAYRDRILHIKRDKRYRYVMVFKNHSKEAGASLDHPHSQLIALPVIPKRVKEEIEGSQNYYEKNQRCVFCDILEFELDKNLRIIAANDDFVCLAPYASRFPFEMWLLPANHQSHFEDVNTKGLSKFAEILRFALKRMSDVLEDPPYNYMLHTAPCQCDNDSDTHYHWHLEITPKLTQVAGFEWGTGFYINPVPPETAAEYLRMETNNSDQVDLTLAQLIR